MAGAFGSIYPTYMASSTGAPTLGTLVVNVTHAPMPVLEPGASRLRARRRHAAALEVAEAPN